MTVNISLGVKHIWNNFWVISLKACTKKQKPQSFAVSSLTSFSIHFFLTEDLHHIQT